MKLLQLYNQFSSLCGGEEDGVRLRAVVFEKNGWDVKLMMRTSRGLEKSVFRKIRAFGSGIYSFAEYKIMSRALQADRPDVVHAQNLYPLFSPSVLVACHRLGVPVVMSIHNYNLTCPSWYHLYKGNVCNRCLDGREYWCVLRNCTGSIFKSIGYALRSAVARKWGLFKNNVTFFVALTKFAKERLVEAGFSEARILVVPNMISIPESVTDPSCGQYIAYAGRISPEKGIERLLEAAARLPDLEVRLAGDGPIMPQLIKQAPPNVTFLGRLDSENMGAFYQNARFSVVPSLCFEAFGRVAAEAMSHGLPVIASRIDGGLSEIVDEGVTGLFFEPGNSEDLANKMKLLWGNPKLCRQMGRAGREKAIREYSEDVYYRRLMAVYEMAIESCKERRRQERVGDER